MANHGVPFHAGLAANEPPLPGEWREGSGLALAERDAGRPADPLLFALIHHHPRMHDGRPVDAAERLRIAAVVVQPARATELVPMVEATPDDEAPAVLARRLRRRSRIATLVPAGKVTGWVPQWKRQETDEAIERSGAGPDARETAAEATCKAVTAGETAPLSPERASETRGGVQGTAASVNAEEAWRQGGAAKAARGERRSSPRDVTAGRDPHPHSAPTKPPRPKRLPSIEHIVAVAERHAGLEPGGLGLGRAPAVTAARQVAMWLSATLLGWDMARLGATFGRDRTSARHAVRIVTARYNRDDAFAEALDSLVAEAKAEPRTRRRKITP